MNGKGVHLVAFTLTIIGGLNWGLIGIGAFAGSDWNVVHMILGSWPIVEWIVYVLVGLSALWLAIKHKQDCKYCSVGGM
ncbi:hypothetical protein A3H77_01475 [Candidatus Kaiserbacteria bacterium RIFCSPLOWO2_02_FULL_56_11]|uniref:DUF378 domain-containing protein n=2 Tax=Candidatus Kaiseribacteriota TaxID=1752734 RepID=A0A1F6E340_9BACT|nr:MAG: hypothetical protein A3C95_00590 [Candidatus Kaiserbacteria bacterium RIFCSPHIGHO2_02_FULL_56_30]OGG72210.1 MAG: hypothetical protein A3E65_00060 [Candidatus Kaiserbacteria bacterium RIFCSPHIGHO2_12_FULL_56_13]OGG81117.1 MAG: hypothetical protein A3H77_01475 [Candidatus Kaiserbacteria bacterium RIFCSPLOWO2_02_FULL_56_11]